MLLRRPAHSTTTSTVRGPLATVSRDETNASTTAPYSASRLRRFLLILLLVVVAGVLFSLSIATHELPSRAVIPSTLPSTNRTGVVKGLKSSTGDMHRFPQYGTASFSEQCPWAVKPTNKVTDNDCIYLVQREPNTKEGLSYWTVKVASSFILARKNGCQLKFGYDAPAVDLEEVLVPRNSLDRIDAWDDWTIPPEFACVDENNCSELQVAVMPNSAIKLVTTDINGANLTVTVPNFRDSGMASFSRDRVALVKSLQTDLPGFQYESGMACSLGSLFRLAPGASKYEPDLFTRLLPALRDEDALVIAVYIRTAYTDARNVQWNRGRGENTEKYRAKANSTLNCVLGVEQEYFSGIIDPPRSFSRVVWMLLTDSAEVKKYAQETYHGRTVNAGTTHVSPKRDAIPREVLVTRSRGVHSKPELKPSTADFSEGFIDWHLIGESDVVVIGSVGYSSFGRTAALRTNRPVRLAGVRLEQCSVHTANI